jgi:glutathione S-transferase
MLPNRPLHPIKLYRHPLSGHAHRAELMLALLDLPVEFIDIDFQKAEQKQAAFLALNAFGQVPVIDDNGTIVADSNAILVYLASKYGGSRYLRNDPAAMAEVQRWLSVAAGQIARGPAAARVANLFNAPIDLAAAQQTSHQLFAVMDRHLASQAFLVDGETSLADIACYSYIAHAPEGGIDLTPYPHIRAWLGRIEVLPRFVPMPRSAVGLQASASTAA